MLAPEIRDLLTQTSTVAGSIGLEGERARHEVDIGALFDRCRSTFGAIRVLLSYSFVHEAVILARPLFTDSLVLAELAAASEERRVEIVAGWMLKGSFEAEMLFEKMDAAGRDVAEQLQTVAEFRRSVERYARRHGVGTAHWEPNEKNLADRHGRADEYLDYQVTHQFVHGTADAIRQRYSPDESGGLVTGGSAAVLEPWAAPIAVFATYSMLLASRHTCRVLDLPEPSELQQLFAEVERLRPAPSPPTI